MICQSLSDALKAAEQAEKEGLLGLYPSACRVMAAHIKKELKDLEMLKGSVTEATEQGKLIEGCVIHARKMAD